jgi:hypothetical protein
MKKIKIVRGKPLPNYIKVQLLEQAYSLLFDNEAIFICSAVYIASGKIIHSYEVFEFIPELLKYRPDPLFSGEIGKLEMWFHPDWRRNRMYVIKNTINDIREVMR